MEEPRTAFKLTSHVFIASFFWSSDACKNLASRIHPKSAQHHFKTYFKDILSKQKPYTQYTQARDGYTRLRTLRIARGRTLVLGMSKPSLGTQKLLAGASEADMEKLESPDKIATVYLPKMKTCRYIAR